MPHPDGRCRAVTAIRAAAARTADRRLGLVFTIEGDIESIAIPPREQQARADGLWQHTCLEVFVRAGGDSYFEFNLSPSGQWAAYRFGAYRDERTDADIPAPIIQAGPNLGTFLLIGTLGLDGLAGLPPDESWNLGLSAVIEEKDGNTSYWALAHPPGKPDFHHPDCFVFELPPPV
jgi:hypothetical protein